MWDIMLRSPKPRAEGSSPSAPAKVKSPKTVAFMRFSGIFWLFVKIVALCQ